MQEKQASMFKVASSPVQASETIVTKHGSMITIFFFKRSVFFKLVKQEINNLLQFLAPSSAGWANGRET
jgi:hypothetical protein